LKTTLKHISTIQTGIYAQTVSSGTVVYLQAKHFNESGYFYDTVVPDLPLNNQTEKHLLNNGDIIFAAKGSKNFAAQYESKNGPCVASSTFLVIRLNDKFRSEILSEYLVWFLNHSRTQDWLKIKARGSSIPSISKTELQDLEISVPSVEKQRRILIIDLLQKRERQLIKQIQALKEKCIQKRLISAINR
jgi:restriction endonuclease S subunit